MKERNEKKRDRERERDRRKIERDNLIERSVFVYVQDKDQRKLTSE
jgi:hypothetical protein